jgi:hypothetical protein
MTDNTMAKEKENQQLEKKNSIEKYAKYYRLSNTTPTKTNRECTQIPRKVLG